MPTGGIGVQANRSYIGHIFLDTGDQTQQGDKGVGGHNIGAVIVQHNLSRSPIKKMLVPVIHGCVTNHTRLVRHQDTKLKGCFTLKIFKAVWTLYK